MKPSNFAFAAAADPAAPNCAEPIAPSNRASNCCAKLSTFAFTFRTAGATSSATLPLTLASVSSRAAQASALLPLVLKPAEVWSAGLDDARRRRLNHPSAVWAHWCRATKVKEDAPAADAPRQHDVVKSNRSRSARPILFSGDHIRCAAEKMRESRSSDFYTLARLALQGALRTKEDLIALLEEPAPDNTKAAPIAAVALA